MSSSNVVTLTLSNVTEDVTTKTITGTDPFEIDETSNVFVFEETAKIGTVPYTVTVGTETYTNTVTATTEEVGTVPNTDFSTSNAIFTYGTSGTNQAAMIFGSDDAKYLCVYNPADGEEMFVYKGDPTTGSYALYGGTGGNGVYKHVDHASESTYGEGSAMSWDGKYMLLKKYYRGDLTIFKNNESTSTYDQLIANHTATEATTASWGASAFIPNSYDFVMTRHAYNDYGFRVVYFENSGDTWTEKWTWENPNSGGLTHSNSDTKWGRFGFQFSKDKKYAALTSYANPTSVAVLKVDLENTTTQNKFVKIWEEGITQGYACAMSPDGKYIIAGNQKIFKNNDAGDWTTKTEVQSEFTNNTIFTDYCIFLGDKYVASGNTSSKHLFEFYPKKEITLTYNGKDMLTLAHNGGLTTTSVKLYKDDILYHTFGASETSVVLGETGVYQAIADDKYYSLKVTVTTVTETQAELYMSHRECFLLKKDGKVWYWGEATNGGNATGNNTTVNVATLNDNLSALPSGIKQIGRAAVDPHCRCAITNDGKLYTWGYNGHGGLGRGNTTDYTNQGPWLVSTQSSNTFTFCHSSYYSNFALQNNGYLWSCGYNGQYVLGTGNNSQQNTFYRINLPNVIDFDCNHDIALAVTSDSEVYIWGTEGNSSMGGASGTTGTPTHLTTLDGKNIVKVRTGAYTGHAISSDGKMYSWGRNNSYQIPKGSTGNVTTPTEMTWFSRKNIKIVDIKLGHHDTAHLALDDQGNMYIWGINSSGSTGVYHHHPTTHSWPVLLKTNIASISCGYTTCGCIDKFGQVYTWGDAAQGQQNWIHGSNSDTDINYPTSNNLSVGSSVVYDGFDKYLLGKDTTVTSNVTFGSNTVSLGTKSEVFISDPHTYKFKIMESGKTTYTSTVISSTPTRPTGRVYPPKSGTHKSLTTSGSANVDNTWTTDGALYGNGDYKASMDKNTNSSEHIYHAFSGVTGYGHMHTNNLGSTAAAAIQLHMPQKIKLTKYAMYSRNFTGEYNYAPRDWKVYGSNDNGTNWTELDSQTNQTVSAWGSQLDHRDTKREYTVSGNTKYFSSYKLDVTANGGGAHVVISQIEYYGDEEGFLSDDGFGKLTLDVKGDTSATSNIVFHSNTYVMGAARDLYITDTGEYTADIFGSNKHFLGSKTHTVSANATEFIWKADGTEDQILYSSDIAAADAFGERISIDGNYAVVGARQADPNGTLSGAAYVFYKSGGTWSQQQKLVASDSSANYEFGYCVDISGDTIVVGSGPYDGSPGSNSGKVYVFKRTGTTWTQQAAFQSSDVQTEDYFGWSVSIHGDYIIAGARVEDTGGSNAGSAYIFKKYELGRAWPPIAPSGSYTLTNSNKDVEWTVSGATYGNGTYRAKSNKGIHGSSFIYHPGRMFDYNISDYYEFHTGSGEWDQSGTVDIDIEFPTSFVLSSYELTIAPYTVSSYAPTNWTILGSNDGSTWSSALDTQTQMSQLGGEIYTLTGNTTAYNHYRLSVSATPQNNCVVRELRYYQSSSTEPTITRWSQQAKIQSKHINANDNFGSSVSIHGDYAIIASYLYDEDHPDVASNRGAAYIFKREGTTWRQQIQLQPSDPGADDHFGGDTQGVDIYGDYAVVGARLEDSNGSNAGSAYVFKKTSTTLSTVKNPYFTDASTIETNGNWSSSTGFEITASSVGASQNGYNAFDNTYTADNAWESTWLSGSSMPAWVQIQYPEDVVIKSYTIVGRDATNRYYPTSWQLQGATAAAPSTYVNLETTSGNRTASSWAPLAEVSHNVNTPNTAYRSFRLYVNSSNENNQVSINELKLYTTPLSGQSATVEESWTQQAKIQASDVQLNSQFGVCVSISGDRLVVGAVSDDRTATDAGAAYIFERSGTNWTEVKKITASDAQASDSFGISVAIDGTNVIVGAYGEDTKGSGAGAAYIFSKALKAVPTLNFDGYNKLSIDNVDLRGYVESPTDNDKLPRASTAEREIAAGNWTPHYDYIYEAQSSPTGFYRFKICNQSASTPSNPTSDTSNTHTNNRHSILYEISTGKWYDGSPNADPNYITTTSTYAAESVTTANPAQIWTWIGTTLNDSYVLSSLSWSQPPPDGSSTFTIKKDGAAFATTTSNTVYIRDTGTYTAEVKGLGAYVTEVSKTVGSITNNPSSNFMKTLRVEGDHDGHNESRHIDMCDDGSRLVWCSPMKGYTSGGSSIKGVMYIYKNTGGVWSLEYTDESSSYHNFGRVPTFNSAGTSLFVAEYYNDQPGNGAFDGRIRVYDYDSSSSSWSNTSTVYGTNGEALGMQSISCNDTGTVFAVSKNAGQAMSGGYKIYSRPSTSSTSWTNDVNRGHYYDVTSKQFGISLSMDGSGTRLLIGGLYGKIHESNYDSGTGSWSTPTQVLSKTANFGYEIEIARDLNTRAAIRGRNIANGDDGIYDRDGSGNWTQTYAFDSVSSNSESKVMRMNRSGTRVILGYASYNSNQGQVLIYDLLGGTWSRTQTITYDGSTSSSGFGGGVAMARTDGNTIGIATPYDDGAGTDYGAFYVYDNVSGYLTYDGKNKITLNQLNYADTSTVTYYSNTYNIGTAKTMYVKDAGEYVFKISGTDKYVESNVYVSSVDLAGATTKPISFDGYNKLTLIDAGCECGVERNFGCDDIRSGKCERILH